MAPKEAVDPVVPPRARRRPWRVVASLALLAACGGEQPKPPPDDALHEIDLSAMPAESSPAGFFGSGKPDFRTVTEDIADLAKDERSKGLLVRIGPLEGAWGARHDLAQVLAAYRAAGKPVHCHFTDTDNVGYALAAASCDRISMTPAGTLNLVGPALQMLYGRELLDSVGVQAELLHVGKYKGAAEPLTRNTMSEPLRQSLSAVLDDLDNDLAKALAKRVEEGKNPVEAGPYSARAALAAGLIDGIDYDDAARAKAKTAAEAKNFQRLHEPERPESLDLATLWKALTDDGSQAGPRGDRLGYVVLSGEIVDGRVPQLGNVVADPTVRALRDFADDSHIKAVVIRIDSPGGSALASDRIWHAVRRVAGRKPVAVSVGDMAASGGYYIASAGRRIFASPSSLVGSIGVVGGKVSVRDLAEEHGVHATTLTRGPQAAWLSPLSPFSEAERNKLQALLQRTYRLFVRRVSLGRDLPWDDVEAYAQGRVMTAAAAQQGKLVDELGSLHEALMWAREEAGLPDDSPVETWPGEAEAMAALTQLFGGAHAQLSAARTRELILEHTTRDVVPTWLRQLHRTGGVATALPLQLQVR